jgi:aspartyl-tRNA(Asn)/glutamyl-tRNA(Gln) amidotransferase subunit C
MSRITRQEVERVAQLARLRLAPEEAAAMAADLDSLLDYVDQLGELDTRQVEPTAHVLPLATPLRADVIVPSLLPGIAVANAPGTSPERDGSAFSVPPVLEGEEEG